MESTRVQVSAGFIVVTIFKRSRLKLLVGLTISELTSSCKSFLNITQDLIVKSLIDADLELVWELLKQRYLAVGAFLEHSEA